MLLLSIFYSINRLYVSTVGGALAHWCPVRQGGIDQKPLEAMSSWINSLKITYPPFYLQVWEQDVRSWNETGGLGMRLDIWEQDWRSGNKTGGLGARLEVWEQDRRSGNETGNKTAGSGYLITVWKLVWSKVISQSYYIPDTRRRRPQSSKVNKTSTLATISWKNWVDLRGNNVNNAVFTCQPARRSSFDKP